MRRFSLIPYVMALLLLGTAVQATPFFARTYGFSCETCHSGFPRLNAFGLAFKANGFRIPGGEKSAPLAWQKTIPLATQIQPTTQRFSPGHVESDFTDTQLLAGGLLTRSTSFYIHHSLWIDDKPTQFPSYEVWVQQVLDEHSKLMIKVGQFELPFAYSPGINRLTVNGPLLFGAGLEGNDVRLGRPMRGVQLSGLIGQTVRWYVAYGAPSLASPGNTVGEREFLGEFRDIFLRVATSDPAHQVGFFTYETRPSRDPNNPNTRERGQRYGFDGVYNWRGIQVSAMAVYGENSNPAGTGKKNFLHSGFIEIDRMFLPWIGLTGRWDVQTIESSGKNLYSDSETISLRIYPIPKHQNLKLVAEYQQRDHRRSNTALMAAITF